MEGLSTHIRMGELTVGGWRCAGFTYYYGEREFRQFLPNNTLMVMIVREKMNMLPMVNFVALSENGCNQFWTLWFLPLEVDMSLTLILNASDFTKQCQSGVIADIIT